MSIRDCSNRPDSECPAWVVRSRERKRYLNSPKYLAWRKADNERIKREIEALKMEEKS